MENIDIEIRIVDYLQNHLPDAERKEVEQLLHTSPAFAAKFEEIKQVWGLMDEKKVPATSPELKSNFQSMLKSFELGQKHGDVSYSPTTWSRIASLFVYKPKYNWAYSIVLICFGALTAYLISMPRKNSIKNLSQEVNDIKQIAMLSMLENNTATERMKAVSYTRELKRVDDKVIDALLTTLNNDDNENVRLVTLDALVQLADNPKVREGLVSSLINQESELMQVALADAMLKLQEKKSVISLKKLLENQGIDPIVKKKLEQTVKKLELSATL
ncbi:MAG: HEAT repeat domain-containing protein [Chitinophagaceae bacterium]